MNTDQLELPELEDAVPLDGPIAQDNEENQNGGSTQYDDIAVDLKGSGIDFHDLRGGKDVDFEIDPSSISSSMAEEDDGYFNKEELFKQLNYECTDCTASGSEDEEAESLTPFERMSKRMEDLTNDGGVRKVILKQGAGDVVPASSLCRVHFNGYLDMSDEPFDSSRLRGRVHQFKLGAGEAIIGWDIGVATMKRGEISRFMMKHNYAYGNLGCPPRIPEKATVMFEIELLSFVDQSASDAYSALNEDEREKASFIEIYNLSIQLRQEGNEAFTTNQVGRACGRYSRALRLLENARLKDEEDEKLMKEACQKLYLNLSLCDLKQKRSGRAAKYARKALECDPRNVKAIYRLGMALRQLGEFDNAKKQLTRALRLSPNNRPVQEEIQKLDQDIKTFKNAEKDLLKKMMNISTSEPAKKAKPPKPVEVPSQMLEVLKGRLNAFKSSSDSNEISLPINLTDKEVSQLKEIAQSLHLHLLVMNQNGEKSIRVTKPNS